MKQRIGVIHARDAVARHTPCQIDGLSLCQTLLVYALGMEPVIKSAIPVLPAADTAESLNWWTKICGFEETFRDATPPTYAGIRRDDAHLHICAVTDCKLARAIGDQTMVRLSVQGIEALYLEYQKRGGTVHPNGPLQTKPWGTKEFGAIDPNGVCVTFQE
jgi:uncharacterized glyoxalase superfamily protein PhnB